MRPRGCSDSAAPVSADMPMVWFPPDWVKGVDAVTFWELLTHRPEFRTDSDAMYTGY
jgi:hypothetical protein